MTLTAPAGLRGVFRTDDAARDVYSEAAGIGRIKPAAVAVVSDADDVATLVRWARAAHASLVPRGSGSGMAGGAIGPGVIVDLSRLRGVGAPDAAARLVRVEAGSLCGDVARAAAAAGLRMPVDPSSSDFATIGGMISTNAAGPHSLQYGAMRPWVNALECVFDDGARATLRRGAKAPRVAAMARFAREARPHIMGADRTGLSRAGVRKDSSGYGVAAYQQSGDVIDLIVGGEGTLAIVTAAELVLTPLPAATASLLLAFPDLERAVEAAGVARSSGAAACELLDRTFIAIAARAGTPLPVPDDTEAVLLVEIEAAGRDAARSGGDTLLGALRSFGATVTKSAFEPAEERALWEFRHAASPALRKLDPRLKSMQFIEDAAVPPHAVASYVRGVRRILAEHGTDGVIFGHAGDAHIHVNPLVDVADQRWRDRVARILHDVTELVADLGGTLSGEHGDGRLRAPLLDRTWSREAVDLFALVKRSFDPDGVFNPGAKVPLAGQPSIGDVKYDPTLPALAFNARRALDLVERDRGYSRTRLDLL